MTKIGNAQIKRSRKRKAKEEENERTRGSVSTSLPSERVIMIPLKSWPTLSSVGALMRTDRLSPIIKVLKQWELRTLTSERARARIHADK